MFFGILAFIIEWGVRRLERKLGEDRFERVKTTTSVWGTELRLGHLLLLSGLTMMVLSVVALNAGFGQE